MTDRELNGKIRSRADQMRIYSIALRVRTGLVLTDTALTIHRTGAHRQVVRQLHRATQMYADSEHRIALAEEEGKDTTFVRQLLLDFRQKLDRLHEACYGTKLNGNHSSPRPGTKA